MSGKPPVEFTSGSAFADDASRFIQLFVAHERQLRAYLFHLLPDRDDVDEVMQNASLALWKKFGELEDEGGFIKWACVVARYEVLMYRRRKARDRLILDGDLLMTLSDELLEDPESIQAGCRALRTCLENLVEHDRRLILQAYGEGLKISRLASQLNRSAQSLYRDLSRLRRQLVRCVQVRLENLEFQ